MLPETVLLIAFLNRAMETFVNRKGHIIRKGKYISFEAARSLHNKGTESKYFDKSTNKAAGVWIGANGSENLREFSKRRPKITITRKHFVAEVPNVLGFRASF